MCDLIPIKNTQPEQKWKAAEKDTRESRDGLTKKNFPTYFLNLILHRIEQGMSLAFLCVFSPMLDSWTGAEKVWLRTLKLPRSLLRPV